jgi:pimeloyl-ACP methyl ester carboxylesterase
MTPRFNRALLAGIALFLIAPDSALAARTGTEATAAPAVRQMEHISVQILGGTGTPVILIPGLSSPRAAWDGVAPALARNHRVYLVQVNGFGGDDPRANLQPGILTGIVADLRRLIADERLEEPAVVGHSMGGLVGLMLAARHPGEIGRLMVVDALPFFSVLMAPPGTEVSVAMVEPRAAQMRDSVSAGFGRPPDSAAADANVAGMTLRAEHRPMLRDWAMAADPRVVGQVLYEDLTTDLRSELPQIRAPVTVAYAWNETFPRRERADLFFRQQYAGLARVTWQGIGESAHFIMLDQPARFREALDSFLR